MLNWIVCLALAATAAFASDPEAKAYTQPHFRTIAQGNPTYSCIDAMQMSWVVSQLEEGEQLRAFRCPLSEHTSLDFLFLETNSSIRHIDFADHFSFGALSEPTREGYGLGVESRLGYVWKRSMNIFGPGVLAGLTTAGLAAAQGAPSNVVAGAGLAVGVALSYAIRERLPYYPPYPKVHWTRDELANILAIERYRAYATEGEGLDANRFVYLAAVKGQLRPSFEVLADVLREERFIEVDVLTRRPRPPSYASTFSELRPIEEGPQPSEPAQMAREEQPE